MARLSSYSFGIQFRRIRPRSRSAALKDFDLGKLCVAAERSAEGQDAAEDAGQRGIGRALRGFFQHRVELLLAELDLVGGQADDDGGDQALTGQGGKRLKR